MSKKYGFDAIENLDRMSRMGMFDNKTNPREIMEQFNELNLRKLAKYYPKWKKSPSLKRLISKHNVVWGGSVATGVALNQKEKTQKEMKLDMLKKMNGHFNR